MRLHVRGQRPERRAAARPESSTCSSGRSSIAAELEEGQVVDDLLCPHCGSSLVEKDAHCDECGSPVGAVVDLRAVQAGRLLHLQQGGLHWHGISRTDEARIKPKVARQKKPEQDALLRIRNFKEVSYGFDRELAVIEAEPLPPLQEAGVRGRLSGGGRHPRLHRA